MSPPRRSAATTEQLRASLVEHAGRLIARDGAGALTMRALADEAGCAVGLPYKVFADRRELVAAIVHSEFDRLGGAFDELVGRAASGTGTVGGNLVWFAEVLLDSAAVPLAREVMNDEGLVRALHDHAGATGHGPPIIERTVVDYLAAEQAAGRVRHDVDVPAFGFVVAGAVHNLVVSGDAWPRPSRGELRQRLVAVADAIAPPS